MWEKNCLVCDSISTGMAFTTESCQETFNIHKSPLNSDSKKVLHLLTCKVRGEVPYLAKANTKFRYRFNNYKSKYREFKKGNQKIL